MSVCDDMVNSLSTLAAVFGRAIVVCKATLMELTRELDTLLHQMGAENLKDTEGIVKANTSAGVTCNKTFLFHIVSVQNMIFHKLLKC